MKKLMIAAAAAAMIGGAYAEADYDSVYDYTINVKTTGAKMAKGTKATYTVKLGQLWWEDVDTELYPAFEPITEDDNAQKTAKNLLNAIGDKVAFAEALIGEAIEDVADDNKVVEYGVPYINEKGKEEWCTSFKCKKSFDGRCYRVAKSTKYKSYLVGGCCDGWAYAEKVDGENKVIPLDDSEVTVDLMNFFGSDLAAKAKKVEFFAEDGFFTWAGQGSAKWVADDEVYEISSISGNIVGKIPGDMCPPDCAKCGELGIAPVFFDCDGDDASTGDLEQDKTAAFGTFTIKLNKKLEIVEAE